MDKKDEIEIVLSTTINKWLSQNQGIEVEDNLQKEIELVVKAVTNKELSEADLGGLKALRGFYYQYLVAVFYMVEVNYENSWDIIAFEILDDITLINVEKSIILIIPISESQSFRWFRTITSAGESHKSDVESHLQVALRKIKVLFFAVSWRCLLQYAFHTQRLSDDPRLIQQVHRHQEAHASKLAYSENRKS